MLLDAVINNDWEMFLKYIPSILKEDYFAVNNLYEQAVHRGNDNSMIVVLGLFNKHYDYLKPNPLTAAILSNDLDGVKKVIRDIQLNSEQAVLLANLADTLGYNSIGHYFRNPNASPEQSMTLQRKQHLKQGNLQRARQSPTTKFGQPRLTELHSVERDDQLDPEIIAMAKELCAAVHRLSLPKDDDIGKKLFLKIFNNYPIFLKQFRKQFVSETPFNTMGAQILFAIAIRFCTNYKENISSDLIVTISKKLKKYIDVLELLAIATDDSENINLFTLSEILDDEFKENGDNFYGFYKALLHQQSSPKKLKRCSEARSSYAANPYGTFQHSASSRKSHAGRTIKAVSLQPKAELKKVSNEDQTRTVFKHMLRYLREAMGKACAPVDGTKLEESAQYKKLRHESLKLYHYMKIHNTEYDVDNLEMMELFGDIESLFFNWTGKRIQLEYFAKKDCFNDGNPRELPLLMRGNQLAIDYCNRCIALHQFDPEAYHERSREEWREIPSLPMRFYGSKS